jgi:transposase
MLDRGIVFEIHRLKHLGLKNTKIAQDLGINRDTVSLYLRKPERRPAVRKRSSKLDPFKPFIDGILKEHPGVPGAVIFLRLRERGYTGGITILTDYLRSKKREPSSHKAFIRFESDPGRQMQIDWGHFGVLEYGNAKRRLSAFVIIESYSRMLYVEFTHSQKQALLHRCLLNAFAFFGGTPQELLVDNMISAVIERHGPLIRFNDAFLDFLRPLRINPVACNVRSPQEKGKVERSIGYLRQSFWPLREIHTLADANAQVRRWLDEVANVRVHGGTGDKPAERFKGVRLRPLPEHLPECFETLSVFVHKDFAVRFDGNDYTVPPWTVGKSLLLKADNDAIRIFHKDKAVAAHPRCWEYKKRIEAPAHAEQVRRLQKRLWRDRDIALFASMGDEASSYLEALAEASQPIKKNISRLLELRDEYGVESLLYAIRKALHFKAYGADYIENILYQEMTPRRVHPPVKLGNEELNRIRLSMPSLAEYDAYAVKRGES